jgi:NAD(P)H-hydrate repair Nnr-like enzyme with NAD(P)H-hydrate dehydratase domain
MHVIIGTVPEENTPLVSGNVRIDGDKLFVDGYELEINRGTCSLIAASVQVSRLLNTPPPIALVIGDNGKGDGSRELYSHLINNADSLNAKVITFHYIQPEVNLHNKVLKVLKSLDPMPKLIADAGYMYVAKMSGHAADYDLFTPDAGEIAFLADSEAPHPFYTRGFLLQDDMDIPQKVKQAYDYANTSRFMIVKGKTDFIACDGEIIETVDEPDIEYMEPIGGTGDTITGLVSALIYSGMDIAKASVAACRINRLAGELTNPTPATQVHEIIANIPEAIRQILNPVS